MKQIRNYWNKLINYFTFKCEKFHKTKQGRIKFRNWCICVYSILFIFIIVATLLCYFGGANYEKMTNSTVSYNDIKISFIVVGIIIFLITCFIGTIISYAIPKIFHDSQERYFQTEEFKRIRQEKMLSDLTDINTKELKWLKKLHYIDYVKYEQTLNAKLKKKETK